MPTYQDLIWKDYKLSVKPIGCRGVFRFKSWYFIPYFNGTNVNLAITIKNLSNEKRKILYMWELYRWDGKNQIPQKRGGEWCDVNPRSRIRDKLAIPYLSIPNHYYIHARLHDKQGDTECERQVVANFALLNRDAFTIKIVIAIGILMLGGIITGLVKLFWE